MRVLACGICGSDLHTLRGPAAQRCGGVPGHEIAAIPHAGPTGLADGVYAIDPVVGCGVCDHCACGAPQRCPRRTILGVTAPGGLAEMVDCPLENLHPAPAALDPRLVTLAEPVAVCLHALARARVAPSSRVLVLGAGPLGLIAALLLRDRAASVTVTARHPHQRAAAARLGATALDAADVAAARAWDPDVVLETVGGTAPTLALATAACRPGGTIVVLGMFAGALPLDAHALVEHELRIEGSSCYGRDARGPEMRAAVALVARHGTELAALQTHRFPLSAVEAALACAADRRSGSLKVTVDID